MKRGAEDDLAPPCSCLNAKLFVFGMVPMKKINKINPRVSEITK